MNGGSWFANRLDVSRWTAILAVGDLVALTAFVASGQYHHSGTNPFTTPMHLVDGLAPFVIGWVVVALLGGLYTHDALLGPRRMLSWSVPAWLFAGLIALALRSTDFFYGNVTGLFPLVALGFGFILVVGWRTIAAFLLPRPT